MATKTKTLAKKRATSVKKIVAKRPAASATKSTAKKASPSKAKASVKTKSVAVKKASPSKAPSTKKTTKAKASKKSSTQQTSVRVNYDVGFGNSLYIRGEGAGLSWDKGLPMTCEGQSSWTWQTKKSAKQASFKILINDEIYEEGANHSFENSSENHVTPHFNW